MRCSVLPVQRPHPPVWVGANGPIGIARIAKQGLPWLAPSNVRRNWAVGNLADYRAAPRRGRRLLRARRGVPDPPRPVCRRLLRRRVTPSPATAVQAAPTASTSSTAWTTSSRSGTGIKEKALFFGSPDDIAAKIQDFADAGYNHFVFRAQWLGLPIDRSIEIVERFAREVMPRFRP